MRSAGAISVGDRCLQSRDLGNRHTKDVDVINAAGPPLLARGRAASSSVVLSTPHPIRWNTKVPLDVGVACSFLAVGDRDRGIEPSTTSSLRSPPATFEMGGPPGSSPGGTHRSIAPDVPH